MKCLKGKSIVQCILYFQIEVPIIDRATGLLNLGNLIGVHSKYSDVVCNVVPQNYGRG